MTSPAPPARRAPLAPVRVDAADTQVLLYQPSGPIGGTFICSRCGAAALQPDLLDHRGDCEYVVVGGDLPGR
jgi:hypothetical protein